MLRYIIILAWLSLSANTYSQSLVAYYPFNGNNNDESGNGVNPTYTGSGVTMTTDRFGNANSAYQFDGAVGSYMRMPAGSLPTTNRTVSVWFNAGSVTQRPFLLAYGGQGYLGYGTSFLMGLNASGCACYHSQAHYGTNSVSYGYSSNPVNEWIHWVVTINGSTTKMFVNGSLVANAPGSFTSNTYVTGTDLALGVMINAAGVAPYTDANGDYFEGKLDDIRIYDNALSDAQVYSLYRSELSPEVVAYFPFNGNSNDESGNSLSGTAANITYGPDRFGVPNKAAVFNGTNAEIFLPFNTLVFTNKFSYSFWYKKSKTTSSGALQGLVDADAQSNRGMTTSISDQIGCNFYNQNSGSVSLSTSQGTTNGIWYHLFITYDGSNFKLYLNGVLKQSTSASGIVKQDANNFRIGHGQFDVGSYRFFGGSIDDVRFYNVSKSDAEVKSIFMNETADPLAYYPFNGNANDESGNGYNGTVSGAILTSDRFSQSNKAYNFVYNGFSSDKIQVPGTADLNFSTSGFTISAWVQFSGTAGAGNNYPIVSKHICGEQSGYILMLYNDKLTFWLAGGGGYNVLETTGSYTDGNWHHVAAVYNGVTQSIYVDGALKNSIAFTYSVFNAANIALGGYNGCNGGFNGKVDDISIYGRALSPNEILPLADVPVLPPLIAYVPCNGNANDMSGNGYNGTVENPSYTYLTADKYSNNNSAYEFYGAGSVITLNNSTGLNFTGSSFTLSAWIKYSNNTATVGIISKSSSSSGYGLGLTDNKPFFWVSVLPGNWSQLISPTSFNDNKWHHVAGVYTGSQQLLYVDGVLKGSLSAVYTEAASAYPLVLGPKIFNGGLYNGMSMDEVKIYGASLNASQVLSLYKQSRGSGRAVSFQKSNANHINIGTLNPPSSFTIEAWVKRNAFAGTLSKQYIFAGKDNGNWAFGVEDNISTPNRLFLEVLGGSIAYSPSISNLTDDNKWHHVSVRYANSSTVVLFTFDGIELTGTSTLTAGTPTGEYSLGSRFATGNSFDGSIDEVRLWGASLTLQEIRDWKNRKLTQDHPSYNNLGYYYNFDEPTVASAYDSKNGLTGLLFNGPAFVTSGASIGDASIQNLANPSAAAVLSLPTGESFSAQQSVGTLLGLAVYLVKDPPENQLGIPGLGNNDHYFGVDKVAGLSGNTANYGAVYNYTGHSSVSWQTEPTLQLYKRTDNSSASWTNSGAVLNTTANTLTLTGQFTEYILGSTGFGLPVTLINFNVEKINNSTARINWQTSTEINNKGFEVQRSFDGNYFVTIQFVNGAGNSNDLRSYSTTDLPGRTGRVFYRLKQVDIDNNFKLSAIASVVFSNPGLVKVYPNPAQTEVTLEGINEVTIIQLLDASGRKLKEQLNNGKFSLQVDLTGLKNGIYLLRLIKENEAETVKLVIGN